MHLNPSIRCSLRYWLITGLHVMVYKYIGSASQQPFPDNNTWPKKLDTTDIGDPNLAHLRARPVIQKPLVDTEQLGPDIPREMLEPLKSRLPTPPFGPPELHQCNPNCLRKHRQNHFQLPGTLLGRFCFSSNSCCSLSTTVGMTWSWFRFRSFVHLLL